ncbi:unnamed protein product, partial [Mesorhabditis spiculigera]
MEVGSSLSAQMQPSPGTNAPPLEPEYIEAAHETTVDRRETPPLEIDLDYSDNGDGAEKGGSDDANGTDLPPKLAESKWDDRAFEQEPLLASFKNGLMNVFSLDIYQCSHCPYTSGNRGTIRQHGTRTHGNSEVVLALSTAQIEDFKALALRACPEDADRLYIYLTGPQPVIKKRVTAEGSQKQKHRQRAPPKAFPVVPKVVAPIGTEDFLVAQQRIYDQYLRLKSVGTSISDTETVLLRSVLEAIQEHQRVVREKDAQELTKLRSHLSTAQFQLRVDQRANFGLGLATF